MFEYILWSCIIPQFLVNFQKQKESALLCNILPKNFIKLSQSVPQHPILVCFSKPNCSSVAQDPNCRSVARDPNFSSVAQDPNCTSVAQDPNCTSIAKIFSYTFIQM
jgi:hypothetical protein